MAGIRVRDDFYTVDKRDPLRKVQGAIQGDRDDVPILVDRGKPFGVLNERGMVQSRINLDEKLADYAVGTKLLTPGASLDEAVRVTLTSGLRWVPVAEDGEAVGYVAAEDLVLGVLEQDRTDTTAWELAGEAPILDEDQTLGEAIRAFREEAGTLHVLPVVDGQGKLSGALHRRKVIQAQEMGAQSGSRPMHKRDPGEQSGPQDSRSDWPVDGLSEAHFETLGPDEGADAVADVLADFGFAFLAEDREPEAVVTPLTALRTLRG
jgi:Mg/Co/Ni transporter MgtE